MGSAQKATVHFVTKALNPLISLKYVGPLSNVGSLQDAPIP